MTKKDYQDFKMHINMKTILLYEEMSGKSFYDVNGEDIMLLVYCALVVNNNLVITLPYFHSIMKNEKIARELLGKCQAELDFIQQFDKNEEIKEVTTDITQDTNNKLSNIINLLILQYGMDVNYVMYEMKLWELSPLIKSLEQKVKADMVEKRFWSYLNICPHIDTKKVKGPEDLLPFPWEKNKKKEAHIKFMEDNKASINAFFNKNQKQENNE